MRLYGGRMIKQQTDRRIADSRELRDAIVWDVTPLEHYCRVKIQGSDQYIKAYYNENWESTPQWLKPGNAVRITHPGGNKGRIEVAGHGFLVPSGSGPVPSSPGDTVISGLRLTAPESGMSVLVAPGAFRIAGGNYIITAEDVEVSLDAASATQFRYDLIVVGTDSVVECVKGTSANTSPVMPDCPANHVALGWVFIPPDLTDVTTAHINALYSILHPTSLVLTVSGNPIDYPEMVSGGSGGGSTTVLISVRDQYGRALSGTYSFNLTVGYEQDPYLTLEYDSTAVPACNPIEITGSSFSVQLVAEGYETPTTNYPNTYIVSETNYGLASAIVGMIDFT